jgi:hypothetical protein
LLMSDPADKKAASLGRRAPFSPMGFYDFGWSLFCFFPVPKPGFSEWKGLKWKIWAAMPASG